MRNIIEIYIKSLILIKYKKIIRDGIIEVIKRVVTLGVGN